MTRTRARHPDLRLLVITDAAQAGPRGVVDVVTRCVAAGAPAIQLRDKTANARDVHALGLELRRVTAAGDALLFVNDRLDVALAVGADGVHLGPADLPVEAARRIAPPPFLVGYSTDDPRGAARAAAGGASYIGCGAVFGTGSKADAADERIGTSRLAEVVAAVDIPVVGIGGIDAANAASVRAAGAAGVAVISAVMGAADPGAAVRALLAAVGD